MCICRALAAGCRAPLVIGIASMRHVLSVRVAVLAVLRVLYTVSPACFCTYFILTYLTNSFIVSIYYISVLVNYIMIYVFYIVYFILVYYCPGLEINILRQWTTGPPALRIWWSGLKSGGPENYAVIILYIFT